MMMVVVAVSVSVLKIDECNQFYKFLINVSAPYSVYWVNTHMSKVIVINWVASLQKCQLGKWLNWHWHAYHYYCCNYFYSLSCDSLYFNRDEWILLQKQRLNRRYCRNLVSARWTLREKHSLLFILSRLDSDSQMRIKIEMVPKSSRTMVRRIFMVLQHISLLQHT